MTLVNPAQHIASSNMTSAIYNTTSRRTAATRFAQGGMCLSGTRVSRGVHAAMYMRGARARNLAMLANDL